MTLAIGLKRFFIFTLIAMAIIFVIVIGIFFMILRGILHAHS